MCGELCRQAQINKVLLYLRKTYTISLLCVCVCVHTFTVYQKGVSDTGSATLYRKGEVGKYCCYYKEDTDEFSLQEKDASQCSD